MEDTRGAVDQGPTISEVVLMGTAQIFEDLMVAANGELVVAQAIYQMVNTLLQVEAVRVQAAQQALAAQQAAENPRGRLIAMPPRV